MTARPLLESDLPALRSMAEASGYPYPDPTEDLESFWVVVDDANEPIMACAAQCIVQLFLWVSDQTPAVKIRAIHLLHDAMAPDLKSMGYHEANAHLPPEVEKTFGRRLARSFGWVRNWPSWCKRL